MTVLGGDYLVSGALSDSGGPTAHSKTRLACARGDLTDEECENRRELERE